MRVPKAVVCAPRENSFAESVYRDGANEELCKFQAEAVLAEIEWSEGSNIRLTQALAVAKTVLEHACFLTMSYWISS